MTFFTEPTGYNKTILSDLQGAWENLRALVVGQSGLEGGDRMLFHIDESMSWETVRNLQTMKPLLTLIRNIALQSKAPDDIRQAIEDISEILDGVLQTHDTGNLP